MGLIQVVVAASMMFVLMVSSMEFLSQQAKSIARLENKLNKVELEKEIFELLENKQSCLASLQGLNAVQGSRQVELRDQTGNTVYSAQNQFRNIDRLEVSQISLSNIDVRGPSSVGRVELGVNVQMVSGKLKTDLKPMAIKVYVEVDGASRIVGCSTDSSAGGGNAGSGGPGDWALHGSGKRCRNDRILMDCLKTGYRNSNATCGKRGPGVLAPVWQPSRGGYEVNNIAINAVCAEGFQ